MNGTTYVILFEIHIVTTPHMYEEYYSWATGLKYDKTGPFDNFDLLVQTLIHIQKIYVVFQLILSQVENYEIKC